MTGERGYIDEHGGYRPAWLDYWQRHAMDPSFPAQHPGWRPSEHERGIAYYAPWEEVFAGFPEHARRCAVTLAATGTPVHLRSLRGGMQFQTTRDVGSSRAFERLKDDLDALLNASIKTYEAEIWQTVASPEALHRLAGPSHHWMNATELGIVYSRRIISTVFERDRVTDSERDCLNRIAGVWVATDHDKRMLERCGVTTPIAVVPIPFFPTDPHLALADKPRVGGAPIFYHIGKWEPRKAHHNIIGGFVREFRPGEAKLYLKTSARGPALVSDYPESPAESVRRWLEDPVVQNKGWTAENVSADVHVIDRRLSPARMVQLHRTGDVYVTLSRGEGFDMPAFDAKLAEKLMIYTPSGGPQSFAAPEDIRIEPTGTIEADPFYGWGRARYLDYDMEAVCHAYRKAYAMVRAGAGKACSDLSAFEAESVADVMRWDIERVVEGANGGTERPSTQT